MARWDASSIPSLDGKVALVTGANSGIGLETAVLLGRAGARVLMACRNLSKAEQAARGVPGSQVVQLDLGSLSSVAAAAEQVEAATDRLDVLVNNAGLMAVDRGRTEDGFETHFGVNHLGHFALTARLAPLLLTTAGSRVVNVSSVGHRLGSVDFDDLMFDKRRYDRWRPYFQSKLANLLFTFELDRRLRRAGAPVSALAAHPGGTRTDLGFEGRGATNVVMRSVAPAFLQPASLGALPSVRAATDPSARGGDFYGPQFLFFGYPVKEKPSRRARDESDARRLWEVSEELTGARFELAPRRP